MPNQTKVIDVAAIRLSAGGARVTQAAFAKLIGVSVRTLRNWEQWRRHPNGAAVALLSLVAHDPGIIAKLSR
jgi:putative transcriptional regulator